MIAITFPDGAQRSFEPGVSGVDIAKSISPSLAKRTVAVVLDGQLADFAAPSMPTPGSNSLAVTIPVRWS